MTRALVEIWGKKYYIMWPCYRKSDPTRERIEKAFANSRIYTSGLYAGFMLSGDICVAVAPSTCITFIFVSQDIPRIMNVSEEGFLKVFRRRFGLGHLQIGHCERPDAKYAISSVFITRAPRFKVSQHSAFKPWQ